MEGSVFFVLIIGIAIGLIVMYYMVKYAVIEALQIFHNRNNNSKLDQKLNDIFIQLGGDPIAFEDAEVQSETKFLEEINMLKKSKLSQSQLRIENERLKHENDMDLIRKKMEIVKRINQ